VFAWALLVCDWFVTGFGFVLSGKTKGKGEAYHGADKASNKGFPDPAERVATHREASAVGIS